MNNVVLPETFLRCVAPADRAKLRAGMTAEEFMARGAAKNERDLQKQIVSLLRLKGIEPNVSRMDKRKTDATAWPDITFAVNGQACCWEVKYGSRAIHERKDERPQLQMSIRLQSPPNNWRWRKITSYDEARKELSDMGIE